MVSQMSSCFKVKIKGWGTILDFLKSQRTARLKGHKAQSRWIYEELRRTVREVGDSLKCKETRE